MYLSLEQCVVDFQFKVLVAFCYMLLDLGKLLNNNFTKVLVLSCFEYALIQLAEVVQLIEVWITVQAIEFLRPLTFFLFHLNGELQRRAQYF